MIRAAVPGDDVELAALYADMHREIHPGAALEAAPYPATVEMMADLIASNDWLTLVADDHGLRGFVIAGLMDTPPPFAPGRYANVFGFYVTPEYRKVSIARALQVDVTAWARTAGAQYIVCQTSVSREFGRILTALGYHTTAVEMRLDSKEA